MKGNGLLDSKSVLSDLLEYRVTYLLKYFHSFIQLFQNNISGFLKVAAAQLELMIIIFHHYICILLICSFPVIYIYIWHNKGNVWDNELTVSHSELNMCCIAWELLGYRHAWEGLEWPCEWVSQWHGSGFPWCFSSDCTQKNSIINLLLLYLYSTR